MCEGEAEKEKTYGHTVTKWETNIFRQRDTKANKQTDTQTLRYTDIHTDRENEKQWSIINIIARLC